MALSASTSRRSWSEKRAAGDQAVVVRDIEAQSVLWLDLPSPMSVISGHGMVRSSPRA